MYQQPQNYPNDYRPTPYQPPQNNNNNRLVKIMLIIAGTVVTLAVIGIAAYFLLTQISPSSNPATPKDNPEAAITSATVPAAQVKTLMPDVKGLSKEDAISRLAGINITVKEIKEVETDKQQAGFVFDHVPAVGTPLEKDTEVTLYVARQKATQPPATQPPTARPQVVTQAPVSTATYVYCKAATYVTLRTGKGINYAKLADIYTNESMVYLYSDGNWYYVRYRGMEGYVYNKYISFNPNAPIIDDGAADY